MAVTLTSAELETELGVTTAQATALLATASALVDAYCDTAPTAISNTAALRVAGWLSQTPAGSIRSESAGDLRIAYAASQKDALRHSGAESLLAPFVIRRAALIE